MVEEVTFPNADPEELSNADGLWFQAYADGKPITCVVSTEALIGFVLHDAAAEKAAFDQHKDVIHQIAERLIRGGRVKDNKVIIKSLKQ